MKNPNATLLDPKDAGELLGLSAAAVKFYDRRLRPVMTSGGRRLYRRSAIERLLGERDARVAIVRKHNAKRDQR